MDINNLFDLFYKLNDGNIENLDLTNEQDNKKFKNMVSELSEKLNNIADKVIQQNSKKIIRPSQNIPVEVGLQIHKLVAEYVDTMIKPYISNDKDNIMVNDIYAGLYEFACWIFNKK